MGSGSDTLNVGPTTILSADHALLEFSANGEVAIGYSAAYGSEFDRSSLFLKANNVETIGKNAFLDGVGQARDLEISFNPTEFCTQAMTMSITNGNAGTLTTNSSTKGESNFNIASAVDRIFWYELVTIQFFLAAVILRPLAALVMTSWKRWANWSSPCWRIGR